MSYNLGWGNAVAVRNALLSELGLRTAFFSFNADNLNYPPHEGDPRLVEITRHVIERQVGPTYKHIFLTNGATGGVTIGLRAYAQQGYKTCLTLPPPYFSLYPGMISSSGLKHVWGMPVCNAVRPVALIDSPSNPYGIVYEGLTSPAPMIWDAVYHSRVYTYGNYKPLSCEALVGSYSKLLGLNGIRTGWIATNDDLLAERLKVLVTSEYCGLSSASTSVLLNVLKMYRSKTFWENFEGKARTNLDYNREEFSKLEKFFGQTPVPANGMFYYAPVDSACRKLLEKSGIIWTSGISLGADDNWGRFNIGQDCSLVREAVKEVLKQDKV